MEPADGIGVNTWATPCNGIQEYIGGEDEANCSIPDYNLYMTVSIGLIIIILTLFFTMKHTMKKYQQRIVKGELYYYIRERKINITNPTR